jgi:hypothetical protein
MAIQLCGRSTWNMLAMLGATGKLIRNPSQIRRRKSMAARSILAAVLAVVGVGCDRSPSDAGSPATPATPVTRTADTPTSPDAPSGLTGPARLMQEKLAALLQMEGDAFLSIQEVGGDMLAQVASGDPLHVNIVQYPSQDDPGQALAAVGLTVPVTWKQEQFDPGEVVVYAVPARDAGQVPVFLHELFLRFLKKGPDAKLECYIEKF